MKRKPKTEEYRMKASKFDEMMRRALATAPLQEPKPKAAKKTRKTSGPEK